MWLIHPAPRDDELLSSWLLRVVRLHGVRPHSFCQFFWPGQWVLLRDIDVMAPTAVLAVLAEGTGTSLSRCLETTLPALEGVAFERCCANGRSSSLLSLRTRGRHHRSWGTQFCPLCLTEENVYRRVNRFAWATCCTRHGVDLEDGCCHCGQPVTPVLLEQLRCDGCGEEICGPPRQATALRLAFQRRLEVALTEGWGSLDGRTGWPAVILFDVLRQLMRVLIGGSRSSQLRAAIEEMRGKETLGPFLVTAHVAEELRTTQRMQVIEMVAYVSDEWPSRLVEACVRAGFWRSWLLRDCGSPRFPLQEVAERMLQPPRTRYVDGRRRPEFHGDLNAPFWDRCL